MAKCTPMRLPQSTPEAIATIPASAQATAHTRRSGIPTTCAAAASSAIARSPKPILRALEKHRIATKAPRHRSREEVRAGDEQLAHLEWAPSGCRACSPRGFVPQTICAAPSRIEAKPTVPMKIVSCELPMSGTKYDALGAHCHHAHYDHGHSERRRRPTCNVSPTTVSAAKSVIAPCAKLKTEEAL